MSIRDFFNSILDYDFDGTFISIFVFEMLPNALVIMSLLFSFLLTKELFQEKRRMGSKFSLKEKLKDHTITKIAFMYTLAVFSFYWIYL
jgi:hypothetical protein